MNASSDNKLPEKGWPKSNGMTVPEGYFDDFARKMMARIPDNVPVATEPKRTTWQIIRPYVYMAAMFAGVYLLMNIFNLTAGLRGSQTATQAPVLAELVNTGTVTYVDDYLSMSDLGTSDELYDELYEAGYELPESF